MKIIFKFLKLFLFINLLTSCQFINKLNYPSIKNFNQSDSNSQIKNKDSMEIRISCNERGLNELLEQGWKIKKEYSEEKICSWKTVPANKKCNMERDKGCKITKPDVIGKETYYLLEK